MKLARKEFRISEAARLAFYRLLKIAGYGTVTGLVSVFLIPNFAESIQKNPELLMFVFINACLGAIGKALQEWLKEKESKAAQVLKSMI